MIGNHYAWGTQGYTILEEGQINRSTLQLDIAHYLVCRPNGEALPQTFATRQAAQDEIDRLERQ